MARTRTEYLLYEEILNGKTKNELNAPRRGGKKKKQVVGGAAVGQHVAKLFVNDHSLPDLFRGVVACFKQDGKGSLYSVEYDDGDKEDLDDADYREAHSFIRTTP